MEVPKYLERIKYQGPLEPTLETLQGLHEAHMLAVPFENLDIPLGRHIELDERGFWRKIVEERRGGFCYELNGLFAWLLRALGFRVSLLSAAVMGGNGEYGPEFDHLALLVHLEEDWLADVGFGESFRRPLLLEEPLEQLQERGAYRFVREARAGDDGELWMVQAWHEEAGKGEDDRIDGEWRPSYRFTLQPHELKDFAEMCQYQQYAPDSHFVGRSVCSLARVDGRITVSNRRLIVTRNEERSERDLSSEEELRDVLARKFGVKLADVGALWKLGEDK